MFNDARLMNLSANLIVVSAVLVALTGIVFRLAHRPMFTLTQLRIAPQQDGAFHYVSLQGVQSTIAGKLAGNFFTVDLQQVRALVETAPWVRRAQVRRLWPNVLVVGIEEQTPFAFWNEEQLINTWGEVFTANQGELDDDANLPHLNGPENAERLVVQRYAELARWFAPLDLHVRTVALSPRYAWNVILSDGLRLNLGRDPAADAADLHGRAGALPFAERIERFVRAWPLVRQRFAGQSPGQTAGQSQSITAVDLRYPDGFALTMASPFSP